MKLEAYKLTKEQKAWIKDDEHNRKVWDEAMESLALGPVRKAVPDFTLLEFMPMQSQLVFVVTI